MLSKLKQIFSSKDEARVNVNRPRLVAINHDDYHAEHIGRTKDGAQFFLTAPFEPERKSSKGCEYVAFFIFDLEGNLVYSEIEAFGPRNTFDQEKRKSKYSTLFEGLGEVEYQRIEIKPFSVKHNNTEVGLIVREPEGEEGIWAVELLPGNYMAFFEPWDSGEYDT